MGKASLPESVLLFSSILCREDAPLGEGRDLLLRRFGEACFVSESLPFTYTDYYHQEMGAPLARIVMAFSGLVPRDCLPEVKTVTNAIEERFLRNGSRTLNIDPGILSLENVCLATTKPYSHRIYLSRGIWAEVTLMFRRDSYHKLEWTYPDYASSEMIRIFNTLRDTYKRSIRCPEA